MENHIYVQRLPPIVTKVIADDLMPQLGKFMARGARFVIASPLGERRAAESVAAAILQRYGKARMAVGLQPHRVMLVPRSNLAGDPRGANSFSLSWRSRRW